MLSQLVTETSQLDKAIKELQKKADDQKMTRACLFNLVIHVEKIERLNYFHKVIHELIEQFPCRIFLIHFDDKKTNLEIGISLISPKVAPKIYCELFELSLPINQNDRLFSILDAHCVNDLPIFYMPTEHGDHLSEFTFRLAKSCQKVICDSTDISDLDAFLSNVNRLTKQGIAVSDLNWSRIESWRQMIAKNLKDDLLSRLSKIEITYNYLEPSKKQYPFQALFLKGFLENRYEAAFGKKIDVQILQKQEPHIWPGAILSCSFFDNDGSKQLFVRNLEKPQEAVIHYESKTECFVPMYVQFTKTESGQSLVKEMRHTRSSQDYQTILSKIKTYL